MVENLRSGIVSWKPGNNGEVYAWMGWAERAGRLGGW
jgi:hypothetical protein